jgi:tetratricopeptide (TPR) repeat protein
MPRPKRLLLLGLSLVSASFLGWSIAASLTSQTTASANRTDEDLQVEPHTRRTLLDILLAQGRFEDALIVLQPWLAEQPRSLNLALLSADLHRLTGNTDGALKELKSLLRLHPVDAQVLQLLVLVEQTNGNGTKALQDLQKRFSDQPPGSRLELGLLVADVQRQDGQPQAAAKMYAQLAAESPTDSRPQLALALLKRDQGQVQEVQALLQQTRQRRTAAGGDTILIDQLAVNWGLSAARINPSETTIPTTMAAADRP